MEVSSASDTDFLVHDFDEGLFLEEEKENNQRLTDASDADYRPRMLPFEWFLGAAGSEENVGGRDNPRAAFDLLKSRYDRLYFKGQFDSIVAHFQESHDVVDALENIVSSTLPLKMVLEAAETVVRAHLKAIDNALCGKNFCSSVDGRAGVLIEQCLDLLRHIEHAFCCGFNMSFNDERDIPCHALLQYFNAPENHGRKKSRVPTRKSRAQILLQCWQWRAEVHLKSTLWLNRSASATNAQNGKKARDCLEKCIHLLHLIMISCDVSNFSLFLELMDIDHDKVDQQQQRRTSEWIVFDDMYQSRTRGLSVWKLLFSAYELIPGIPQAILDVLESRRQNLSVLVGSDPRSDGQHASSSLSDLLKRIPFIHPKDMENMETLIEMDDNDRFEMSKAGEPTVLEVDCYSDLFVMSGRSTSETLFVHQYFLTPANVQQYRHQRANSQLSFGACANHEKDEDERDAPRSFDASAL